MNLRGKFGAFLLLSLLCWHCTLRGAELPEASTLPWLQGQYQSVFYDFNQDKTPDLLLQAITKDQPSVLILGEQNDGSSRYLQKNVVELPLQIAGQSWTTAEAQLLPLRLRGNGDTALLVVFPLRQAALLFRFNQQQLDLSRPIAKYQPNQWPFLTNVNSFELQAADFDQDGIDEILQLDKVRGEYQILKLQANFSLSTSQKLQRNAPWAQLSQSKIIIRDFDNNGFADIFALAKAAGASHYLLLADDEGKFTDAVPHAVAPEIAGLPWFDNNSGTMVVTRRSDQHELLLRFYNDDELSSVKDQNCIGWLYDPLLKTSQEYCLATPEQGNARSRPEQAQSLAKRGENFDVESVPECPIVDFLTGSKHQPTEFQRVNRCASLPLQPTTAPRLDAASYQTNQRFNVHLESTRDPTAYTYEVWAILNGSHFYPVATVVAPGSGTVWPSVTVSGSLAFAGHYQVRFRSCNDNGCSGFGPASSLSIIATPVSYTVATAAGAGGRISPTSQIALQGSQIQFTVTPNPGFKTSSVSGCGGSLSGMTYTTGVIDSSCTVSASFSAVPVYYTVSAIAGSHGTIAPGSSSVVQGSQTSFTVSANAGYKIQTVTGCGGHLSGTTYTTGAINSACTVNATFAADVVYHSVTAIAGSHGSISPASRLVAHGSNASFIVSPNLGYQINAVTGCGGNLSGTTYTTGTINSACTVNATFIAIPVYHTVTASAGSNGSISPGSRSVLQGSTTSFTVLPNPGYRILAVTGCGGNLSGTTYNTGAIHNACAVSVTFTADVVYHSVTAKAGSNGSMTPGSRSVAHGSNASFIVSPNSGYQINSVTGCDGRLSGTTYTTGMIQSACTINATFTAIPVNFLVTAIAGSNGNISPAMRSVVQGSNTSFTVTPASGYQINSVTGCDGVLSGSTYTTGSIQNTCQVSASFKSIQAPIQVIYLHTDALGSVIAETDANGQVIKRSEYKPFGEVKDQ